MQFFWHSRTSEAPPNVSLFIDIGFAYIICPMNNYVSSVGIVIDTLFNSIQMK